MTEFKAVVEEVLASSPAGEVLSDRDLAFCVGQSADGKVILAGEAVVSSDTPHRGCVHPAGTGHRWLLHWV